MEIIIVILTVFLVLSLFAIWIVYQNMVDYKEMYMESLVKEDKSRFSFSTKQVKGEVINDEDRYETISK